MVICAECRHENRDGAKFCADCGVRLPGHCPACGSEVRAASRYCDECGQELPRSSAEPGVIGSIRGRPEAAELATRLTRQLPGYTPKHLAEKILTSRSAIEGERKLVTVLFADCVGFTALSTRLDPEDLHSILDGCFRHILDAVHRYEGTVNQFTGDGVMALFGAPIAHEDHAVRAVGAALEVQNALAEYGERLRNDRGLEFTIRIGLNTGPVVVGKIGDDLRMDYTAQGETVNLAARLQAVAPPDGILVSEGTQRLVEGFFLTESRGPFSLKGLDRPVSAFRVLGQRAGRARFDVAVERGLTPFVGRAREMDFLDGVLRKVASGRGHVVSVVGEGGVGKSRLLFEFRNRLAGAGVTILEGRCLPHGGALPFHLVVRYALSGSYAHENGARQIPSNEEILRELERCEGATRSQ